jgi:formylmethanofuran dehydrogenase subunit E
MNWITNLFSKKEEEEEIKEEAILFPGQYYECDMCEEGILPHEQKKFGGKRFHKNCFKELKKEAQQVTPGK